jgi:hypothetical protein
MRLILTIGTTLGLVITTSLLLGCASTRVKKLSGQHFLQKAAQTDILGSYVWTSYIGNTHDKAYLEYGHPALIGSGMKVTVYWTPLSELPSNIVARIKNGAQPWTNAMDKIGQQEAGPYGSPEAGSPSGQP